VVKNTAVAENVNKEEVVKRFPSIYYASRNETMIPRYRLGYALAKFNDVRRCFMQGSIQAVRGL
jgi:hypothetical protein